MKSLSKGLTIMNVYVLASIFHDGENAELNFNQEDFNQHFNNFHSQNTIFQNRRVSEAKCAQYIQEAQNSAPIFHTGKLIIDHAIRAVHRRLRAGESKILLLSLVLGLFYLPFIARYVLVAEPAYVEIRSPRSGANGVLAYTEIGGRDAFPGEFPHMGALGWRTRKRDWKFQCGSSLISHKFLLTAAHCSKCSPSIDVVSVYPVIVRLGTNVIDKFDSNFSPVDFYIRRIIVHPKYSSPKKYYDIALIELRSKVQFKRNLHPACLWSYFDTRILGYNVTSTGWGVVDPVRRTSSTMLQAIDIDIIQSETCNDLLHRYYNRLFYGIQEHQLCAGKLAGHVDSCEGDSGGPLQVKIPSFLLRGVKMHYLVGITSFGFGCALPNRPGVYTRVSSFIDWIENSVWPE